MTEAKPIRLGVIGLGNIAKQHISHIQSGAVSRCAITASCSSRASDYSQQLSVPHFDDFRQLIDSGLCDAVLVASPSFSHCEIGMYALNAGLHVLMEKPIGLSVSESERMLAQQGSEQVFALMLNQRCDPLYAKMKSLIENDELGSLVRCSWTMTNWFRPEVYFQVSDWRATWKGEGGGMLVNQCIHNLDIYQWLVGMPSALIAQCAFGKYHDIEVEDEASCIMQFDNGATGTFIGSTGEAPGTNFLEIAGDKGKLSFDGSRLIHCANKSATSVFNRETRDMFGMPEYTQTDITPERQVNQHARIIQNFCNAILDAEALIAPASEGLNSLALANAMLLSSWRNAPIQLPLDSALYQHELDKRISQSQLREKQSIEVNIDMNSSYR